jgi:ubiquitin-activating enzyme E1 C
MILFGFIISGMTSMSMFSSQIKKPSLSTPKKQIYFQAPPQLEQVTRPNLEKKVSELVPEGGEVTVTASTLPFSLSLNIIYT